MSTKTIVLAQLGCGYWGRSLLRNFAALADSRVKYLVDPSAQRRTFVAREFPKVQTEALVETALNDPEVDAVIIATPAGTHFDLARRALLAGKHIFVEKPL